MNKTLFSAVIFASIAFLNAKAPQWFLQPSLDPSKLYGFGAGQTIAEAKQNAIADLANSLQANIEATFRQQTNRTESNIASSASREISIYTKFTDLLNIEASKAECKKDRCYTQIEIEKSDLLEQLKQKVQRAIQEIAQLDSPFDYPYKRDIIYPKLLRDYALYTSLGGTTLELPTSIGEKPTFYLSFEYDGDFSKTFKHALETTIQDSFTQFGKISPNSQWQILIKVLQENELISLNLSAKHNEEIIHNALIRDSKKSNISESFFAKRLGIQAHKKIQKWGEQPRAK